MDNKTITYIILIVLVLTLIVLLQRFRTCENNRQAMLDYVNNGVPLDYTPSVKEIMEYSKPCKFWSF